MDLKAKGHLEGMKGTKQKRGTGKRSRDRRWRVGGGSSYLSKDSDILLPFTYRVFLGTTSGTVLAKCKCSVLVVKAGETPADDDDEKQ